MLVRPVNLRELCCWLETLRSLTHQISNLKFFQNLPSYYNPHLREGTSEKAFAQGTWKILLPSIIMKPTMKLSDNSALQFEHVTFAGRREDLPTLSQRDMCCISELNTKCCIKYAVFTGWVCRRLHVGTRFWMVSIFIRALMKAAMPKH